MLVSALAALSACGGGRGSGFDGRHRSRCDQRVRRRGVGGDEECDSGEDNSDTAPRASRATCVSAGRGDGVTDYGEECDDGNDVEDDRCSNIRRASGCGDEVARAVEECDDPNESTLDGCTNECMTPGCGGGVRNRSMGEQCDDGNRRGGDGCSRECAERSPAPG